MGGAHLTMLSEDMIRQNHVGGVGSRLVGVVQGYRPQVDWGGDSGSATIVVGGHNVRVATSGWRRRCLYILLLALLALSVVNLSLTLWILKTIHFNVDGMGPLNVIIGGVEMKGIAELHKKATVAKMVSRAGEDLPINGYYNLSIFTAFPSKSDSTREESLKGQEGPLATEPSFLHINTHDVLAGTGGFSVKDTSGTMLFHVDEDHTSLGAKTLNVTGDGGAVFEGSVQTPHLFSQGVHQLKLESVTRTLDIESADELNVEARDGDISAISLRDAGLMTRNGAIRFDNPNLFVPKLVVHNITADIPLPPAAPTSASVETQLRPPTEYEATSPSTTPLPPASSSEQTPATVQVFEVCVCPNGRLFVVTAHSICNPDELVCR